MRVDGKFVDADGNRPEGQYVSFFCLSSIHQAHSPAVGPALSLAPMLRSYLPVALVERTRFGGVDADSTCALYVPESISLIALSSQANKLSTVKKCLNEVLKYGGPWTPRDLYPVCSCIDVVQSMQVHGTDCPSVSASASPDRFHATGWQVRWC